MESNLRVCGRKMCLSCVCMYHEHSQLAHLWMLCRHKATEHLISDYEHTENAYRHVIKRTLNNNIANL